MKKRILFIIYSYTGGGGSESLLTMIVNHLNPEKYDISIIEYRHLDIKVEKVNSNIHVLPYIQAVETPENYSVNYQLYNTPEVLINAYIKKDYDLYVSFNYQVPTFLLPKGTKNIAWIHSDVYDLAEEKVLRERVRQDIAFGNVKKIVAISDNTEKSIKELFPNHANKLVKIYNGLDVDMIRKKADERTKTKLKNPGILFVGRLEERKDPVRLINVIKLVHEMGIRAHLYFMGNGELEGKIAEEAKECDLSEYIHLIGYQQNPFPIMKQCDVVCLLSKSEGFSMSLLESVALDKPFVATEIGGAYELSNGQQCGQVVKTDEEAADAIRKILGENPDEIRIKCRESIKRFELKYIIDQIESLFDSVLEKNK